VTHLGSSCPLAVLMILAVPAAAQQQGAAMPRDLRAAVDAAFAPTSYAVTPRAGVAEWTARNDAHGLTARFDLTSVAVSAIGDAVGDAAGEALLSLSLQEWGPVGALVAAPVVQVVADGARVEYRRGDLVEWYVNSPKGLEQGFTIVAAPAGAESGDELELDLTIGGELVPFRQPDGLGISLADTQGVSRLVYSDLAAWDADGKTLPARLELHGRGLSIVVQALGATFPLTVDPLIATEQNILTAYGGQALDIFGNSVAISGDTAVVAARDAQGITAPGRAFVFVRSGSSWTQQALLTASDGAGGDYFGESAAISGETVVVGADSDDHAGGTDAGSAYVFVRTGTSWSQQAKLIASDAAANSYFGSSVAVSGDTAIVTAILDDHVAANAGAAYVFVRNGTSWSQQANLTGAAGPAAGDAFGRCAALSGDTAIIGASHDNTASGSQAGAAFVFTRNGTNWTLQAQLAPSDAAPFDQFGQSAAVEGDTAVIGSRTNGGPGAAYVFKRAGSSWTQQAKLTAADATSGDGFGVSVGLSADTAIIGAEGDDHAGGNQAGSAYVFVRSGTSWSQQAKLTASDATDLDTFGNAVAVSGDTAIVGAFFADVVGLFEPGACYAFQRSGTNWGLQAKLLPSGSLTAGYGSAVAISGNTAVVGALAEDVGGQNGVGAVYVYVRSGTTWILQAKLLASDAVAEEGFGNSVAISGDTIVVGKKGDDLGISNLTGSAYVFVRNGSQWTQQAKLLASDPAANDQFGNAVSVDGDTAIVGALGKANGFSLGAGAAYVFVRSGSSWSQQAKIVPVDASAGDNIGSSVALVGDTAVIGAFADDFPFPPLANSGAVYVYVRSGTTWSMQAKLFASDKAASDGFGVSAAISGETLLVGSSRDDHAGGIDAGSAYVFTWSGTAWSQQAKLTSLDSFHSDRFGESVSLSGDMAVIGAYHDSLVDGSSAEEGSAYVFARSGTAWSQGAKLTASDPAPTDAYGVAVAISGASCVVGSANDSYSGIFHAGSAYVYEFKQNQGAWQDLGFGLAGTDGIPRFVGTGALTAGSPGNLTLAGAKPSALCQLHVSTSSTPVPFKQGTFVPYPPLFSILLFTSPSGTLSLPFTWPGGVPSGASLWFQYSISDAAAVAGVALSNAIKATTP
jgi:hypothetical protein